MQIKKDKLIAALEAVKPGLGAKDIVEQSTSFAFLEGFVVTSNDEVTVRCPIDLEIEGAVRATELYSLLNKIKEKEIDLKVSKSELLISGGRFKGGIKLDPEIRLPLDHMDDFDDDWKQLPKEFLGAVKFAAPCTATDMSEAILTCVNLSGRYAEANDGFRLIRVDMGKKAKSIFKEALKLPATAIKSLVRYPVTEFCVSQSWAHFRTKEGVIFSCRSQGGEFPKISHFFDVEGPEVKLPTNIIELLEKAGIFAKADTARDEVVLFSIEKKQIKIRGEGDFGWFEESTRCAYNGKEIQFAVSPSFLYDILAHLRHCVVGDNALKFEGENFEHVVCLSEV